MAWRSMRLFTGDYLRDTRDLSCLEHGIYLLLLMHCWDTKGLVPLDETAAAACCNARNPEEIEAMRKVIHRFFHKQSTGFSNKRMEAEITRFRITSKHLKAAGKQGGIAKARACGQNRLALATNKRKGLSPYLGSVLYIPTNFDSATSSATSSRGNSNKKNQKKSPTGLAYVPDAFTTERGTEELARQLGILARPGESYDDLRKRLIEAMRAKKQSR